MTPGVEAGASAAATPLLEVRDLHVHFAREDGVEVRAVDGVDLSLARGEVLALVGESGCGKSTLARAVAGLLRPTRGEVRVAGAPRRLGDPAVQMVFQDPDASLNPRLTIGAQVAEALRLHTGLRGAALRGGVGALLERVGIDPAYAQRHPHTFSGGQRQRIAIARALAPRPQLLLCDEVTSALDVSVQAQVLGLLRELRDTLGLSLLFITHDLAVARAVADRAAVMYLGSLVEEREAEALFEAPGHPYTRALLAAVPRISRAGEAGGRPHGLPGDPPSAAHPPTGCRFHTRCAERLERCSRDAPASASLPGGRATCWLHGAPPA